MTTESDYCGNGFRVKFILKEYWAGGYNAEVKIYNTGDETIENWALGFDYNDDISNIWNAKIVENADNDEIDEKEDQDLKPVVIKNAVWNQDIPAGEYVEFGFSGKGDFVGFPGKYHMLGEMQLADPKDYDIEYKLSSDWGSGYNSSIEIINNTDGDIEDWILEFDYEREITNIWNGTIESHEENHYVIKNSGYNSNIYAGQKIDFGFSGNSGTKEMLPSGFELYYYDVTKEKSENKEEKHSESQNENTENNSNSGESGNEEKTTADAELKYNDNVEEKHTDDAHYGDDKNENQEEKHTDDAKKEDKLVEEIDKDKDTDNDGLFDYIEMQIGTDINKIDTDNDGLTDYFEVMSMVYDPTKIDTDNNGVNDGEEDLDNDGLFNLKEIELKTDIDNNDTDRDGLLDGEEVNAYNTDPCNYDTDGDFVSDKKEIELGTDPLSFNEKFDVTLKAEGVDTVKVAVNVTLTGEQFNTLSVNKVNNDFLFPCDMPGYIGGAYEFKVDGEFDTATLYFEFDKELLKSEDFDPVIYYFNEEKQELEELETKILGNVASTVTTHFSKYILLNRNVFSDRIYDWVDSWTSEKPKESEIILSIGDYDSMGGAYPYNLDTGFFTYGTDPQHKRFEIAKSVIDRFDENNKIGIAKVDDDIEMLTENLISCDDEGKKILKNYLKFTEDKDGIDKKKNIRFDRKRKLFLCIHICTGKSI